MSIRIGPIETRNRVFLAPLSGVTDEPFRAVAHAHGAGLVVSEMVASEELVRARPDMVRRARGVEKTEALRHSTCRPGGALDDRGNQGGSGPWCGYH